MQLPDPAGSVVVEHQNQTCHPHSCVPHQEEGVVDNLAVIFEEHLASAGPLDKRAEAQTTTAGIQRDPKGQHMAYGI